MRLFVALPVADEARAALEAAVAPARDALDALTWTRPEGWHVTLAFLGDVPDEEVDAVGRVVDETVARSAVGPVRLRVERPGRFGDRVLVARVADEPSGVVAELGGTIQSALADAGGLVHERRVRPHLTLARAGRKGAAVDDAAVAALDLPEVSWTADAAALVRSHLGSGPARYETQRTFPL